VEVGLHSLKVAQLLRSAACLHTNQSRSYLNHLVLTTKQQVGNRRGAETQYKNLKLQTWKKGEEKHYLKQLMKESGAWNMLHCPQTSQRSRINVKI